MTPSGTPLALAEPIPVGSPLPSSTAAAAAPATAPVPIPVPVMPVIPVMPVAMPVPIPVMPVPIPVMPVASIPAAPAASAAWVAARLRKRAGSTRLIDAEMSVPMRLNSERTMAAWTTVHDKLAAGEMPPRTRRRPPQGELQSAIGWLNKELHAASLGRQQKQGRVVVRRLNGTEYENTVRDLLGTRVNLKEMLPEDNATAGFDNISTALDVSATHLLLYMEAAEKAVASVIPPHPPVPFRDRRTGKEISDKGPNFRQTLTRSCLLKGDALVVYSKLPRYGLCATAPVPAAGRYKVRMSIAAVGAAKKAVPAAFMTVGQGREDPVLREMRDIPPGKPSVV